MAWPARGGWQPVMKRLVQLALDFDASAGRVASAQPPAASPADQRSGSQPSVPGPRV